MQRILTPEQRAVADKMRFDLISQFDVAAFEPFSLALARIKGSLP